MCSFDATGRLVDSVVEVEAFCSNMLLAGEHFEEVGAMLRPAAGVLSVAVHIR